MICTWSEDQDFSHPWNSGHAAMVTHARLSSKNKSMQCKGSAGLMLSIRGTCSRDSIWSCAGSNVRSFFWTPRLVLPGSLLPSTFDLWELFPLAFDPTWLFPWVILAISHFLIDKDFTEFSFSDQGTSGSCLATLFALMGLVTRFSWPRRLAMCGRSLSSGILSFWVSLTVRLKALFLNMKARSIDKSNG